MSNVPVEKNRTRIPTSMNALPSIVNMRNFIAEYSRRPLPQMDMRKNMGMSSSSQNRKNRKKSREVNTPMTAPWRARSQTKYSLTRCPMLQEANIATIPSRPVSRTSGALRPSTARKYCTLKDSMGIQFGALSTSWYCAAPCEVSYWRNITNVSASSTSETIAANHFTMTAFRPNSAIRTAAAIGRNTAIVSQPSNKFFYSSNSETIFRPVTNRGFSPSP